MRDNGTLRIHSARVAGTLGAVVAGLVVVHLFLQYHTIFVQHGVLSYTFPEKFDLNGEANVPSYFSALLLLGVSVVLASIYRDKRGAPYERHWAVLAIVFLLMSVDEACSFHELLSEPLRARLGVGGWLYYAWIIPAAVFVFAFCISYLGFLLNLPTRFRVLFALAGTIYVGGALGMEIIGGWYADAYGREAIAYVFITTIEETLEMMGLVLFLYATLVYKGMYGQPVHIQISGGSVEESLQPPR